jgi:hypothetical protein
MVNGWMSDPLEFHAGVRQGCPLSPLLYLFVAQALLSWLQAKGHGIKVPRHGTSDDPLTLTGVQYADDFSALLNSLNDLHAFDADMGTFGRASNQYLNKDKTHVMLIGYSGPNAPRPPDNLPYKLVTSAVTLGVRISNERPSQDVLVAFWKPHVETAERCLKRICKLGLTMFGRAFAVNSYAISPLLYRAEFMGFPMVPKARGRGKQLAGCFTELNARIASVIDKMHFKKHTYTGFSAERAVGRPQEGGVGMLPLQEHVNARMAWWGMQLLTAPQREDPHPPWILVARAIIDQVSPGVTPLVLLAPQSQIPPDLSSEDTWEPTARLMLSLQALGTPPLSAKSALSPADLGGMLNCMPIWFNPLLKDTLGQPLEASSSLTACKRVFWGRNVGDLALARRNCSQALTLVRNRDSDAEAQVRALLPRGSLFGYRSELTSASDLLEVRHVFAREWWDACDSRMHATAPRPGPLHGERLVVDRLQLPSAVLAETPLAQLRVRQLTAAQPYAGLEGQRMQMCEFVREVSSPDTPDDRCISTVKSVLKRLWAVPAPNSFKEDMWRMALGGMRWHGLAKHTPGARPGACICSTNNATVTRNHIYWVCPVTRAVIEELEQAIGLDTQRLMKRHVWLAEPPRTAIQQHIWDVVVLAAVTAMASARSYLTSICLSQERGDSARRMVCTNADGSSGSSDNGSESRWGITTTAVAAAAAATATQRPAAQTQPPARQSQQQQRQRQQQRHAPRSQAPPQRAGRPSLAASGDQIELAKGFARGKFWALLEDFALTHAACCPHAWTKHGVTDASHPFFHVRNPSPTDPRLQLYLTRRPSPPAGAQRAW